MSNLTDSGGNYVPAPMWTGPVSPLDTAPMQYIFTSTQHGAAEFLGPSTLVFGSLQFINDVADQNVIFNILVNDPTSGEWEVAKTLNPGDPPFSWDGEEDQRWTGQSFQISCDTGSPASLRVIYSN
jgi:hypothetical protein